MHQLILFVILTVDNSIYLEALFLQDIKKSILGDSG